MTDFISSILTSIDNMGANFSQEAYQAVSTNIAPALDAGCVLYVAHFGLLLMTGATSLTGREILFRITRMSLIIALIQSWGLFDQLFYQWINLAPETVGKSILTFTHSSVSDATSGLTTIWEVANEVGISIVKRAGYFSILPGLLAITLYVVACIFIAIALALIILSKVMIWVLIGTAPIFISLYLFESTKGLSQSWFNQLLLYAFLQLFVYIVSSFMISSVETTMNNLQVAASSMTIQISDLGPFLLICAAGVYILLHVQTLAQGIAGGFAINGAAFAGAAPALAGALAWRAAKRGSKAAWAAAKRGSKSDGSGGGSVSNNGASTSASALQDRIQNQSLPL
ncbi:type IV secretion system protein [Allorhizobium sp. BGMRC 0089]|uniref:type IV secretion system protein n=1 Tax=Allorhizobium sonneratiae TaxID=2934936 RepID=UPI002033EE1C|nr:type IV secretion system protein [Allorhizobium sonneratiae]MCM2294708.1 type IV secretion system protein [Allorhizobium sonneratiae]